MRVRDATGWGIAIGGVIGAIASGLITATQPTQVNAQNAVWWIVVITTIIPLWGYLNDEQPMTGDKGGFLNGLGTGLGFVLLIASLLTRG